MYLQSRRSFLKGAAFTVAGAAIAKGVFTTDAMAESVNDSKFTNTPDSLSFYPPQDQWEGFSELSGEDWKRGGIDRHGVASDDNPDGITVHDYAIVPTACSNCEASCGLTAWIDKKKHLQLKNIWVTHCTLRLVDVTVQKVMLHSHKCMIQIVLHFH